MDESKYAAYFRTDVKAILTFIAFEINPKIRSFKDMNFRVELMYGKV